MFTLTEKSKRVFSQTLLLFKIAAMCKEQKDRKFNFDELTDLCEPFFKN